MHVFYSNIADDTLYCYPDSSMTGALIFNIPGIIIIIEGYELGVGIELAAPFNRLLNILLND